MSDKRFSKIVDGDYTDFSDDAEVLCDYIREINEKNKSLSFWEPIRDEILNKIQTAPSGDLIITLALYSLLIPTLIVIILGLGSFFSSLGEIEGYYIEQEEECLQVYSDRYSWPDSPMTNCLTSWEALDYLKKIRRLDYDINTSIGNSGMYDLRGSEGSQINSRNKELNSSQPP